MYKCKMCGEELSCKGSLGGHMKYHHPKNPVITCTICGEVFTTGGLGGHMATRHPKNGVPHPGAVNLTKVWGNTKEEHDARTKLTRDSRFKYLDDIELTEFQRQMILGSLLGDMCIWKQHKGVSGTSNPELRISQSVKQRDYVMWKYDILKNIARKEPYEFIQKTGFGSGLGSCRFETKSLKCLNPIYDLVIGEDGKKHITQKWLDRITDPVALATWYMDDGSNWWKYMYFSIGLLPKDEYILLQNWLVNKYGVKTSIDRFVGSYNGNTYGNLVIDSMEEFVSIITPNVIPSLKYKLG